MLGGTQNVFASTLKYDFAGYYYERSDNGSNYSSWRLENYYVDGNVAYCIEPGIPEGTDQYREVSWDATGLSNSIKDRVTLLAYYGYQYDGHQTQGYRAATQALIWEAILGGNTRVTYSTERYGAGTPYVVDAERNVINNLVAHHYDKPSMNGANYTAQVGTPISIQDTNGVLSKFEVRASNGAEVSINGNTLTITPTQIGKVNITFVKKQSYARTYLVYYADGYQNMISGGNVDPVTFSVNLTGLGGKVQMDKVDSKTQTANPQGEASLEGAEYGIYDSSDNLIQTIITDSKGHAVSDYLPYFGSFYLKEIKPSKGYQLNNEKIPFISSKDELLTYVKTPENVITRDYEFTKVYASDKTQIMTPEVGIDFGIYNNKNELVVRKTTDHEGKIYVTLPYGSYTLKQLTATKDYEKIGDYKFEVKDLGATINKVLSNAEITAKLKVIKIDAESGKIIERANIKFKIFDVSRNEYVCQTITYPTAKTICEFGSDANGILITPYPLSSGTYRLEEVDQAIDGYLWNKESQEFKIGEDANLITDNEFGILFETKFSNKQVKGEVIVNKIGEKFVVENDSFHYEEVKLSGVKYELYAEKDIYSADGTLVYRANDLINTYETKDGLLKINNLYLGKYYLLEVATKDNHIVDNKKHSFELKYKDQYTPVISLSFTFKNYMKKGTLDFTKTDLVSGDVIPNTKIEVYTQNDKLIFSGITDENGKIKIENLPVNEKLYIIESEPATGYVITDEKVYFEIKDNGEIIKAEMKNKPIIGSLEFTKTDISTSEPLPNTKIEIFNADTDELIFSGITDQDGKITIDELRFGDYYIIESEAPIGYTLNPDKMYFSITEDGEIIKANMKDKIITGTLEFTKTDVSTSEPLPNTKIEIYDANTDELIFSGITDQDGKIIIEELKYGDYYIIESEAPEGYTLNPNKMYFSITEDGEIVKATMTDEAIVEVPNTGISDSKVLDIVGLVLIVAGVGYILYDKKRKK